MTETTDEIWLTQVLRQERMSPTGRTKAPSGREEVNEMTIDPNQDDLDNHANQCNPNNDEYWNSRGEEQPDDWEDRVEED